MNTVTAYSHISTYSGQLLSACLPQPLEMDVGGAKHILC